MHLPYTDRYPEAIAMAAQSLAASLTAVLWSRPLAKRSANFAFGTALWGTALAPEAPSVARLLARGSLNPLFWLHACLLLATVACLLATPRWLQAVAALGQVGLLLVGHWLYASNDELLFAHLAWLGALLGFHALCAAPPRWAAASPASGASFVAQDLAIFAGAFALAAVVMHYTFEEVVYNGDEIANTFQADVFGHLKAYAPVPPCPDSFENYWVFRYKERLFSQYTPGWPLFMAVFQRLGVVWLSGPAAAGLLAVGVARLSRRVVSGFGSTLQGALGVTRIAGPLGAGLLMLGPSVLLNGASRFSHTLVAACFAWAVESVAALTTPGTPRRAHLAHGLALGVATSLGLATRPSDGGLLGVGVFLYFVVALLRRRLSLVGLAATCVGFAAVGGLTLVILRLQLGSWFHTGYSITHLYHPDGKLQLFAPAPGEVKYGIPLATGSYCWWPIAPALGVGGLVGVLAGRERRVAFMLGVSAVCLVAFYTFVAFGRGADDGLGPRYILPVVVAQATGTAALLAPLIARLIEAFSRRELLPRARLRFAGPGVLALWAALAGAYAIAPLVYPVAYAEHHLMTAPLRGARDQHLTNSVVLLEQHRVSAYVQNLAQNAPMDPHPAVLFLSRYGRSDDACIERYYPGRAWYRAGMSETLERVPGH